MNRAISSISKHHALAWAALLVFPTGMVRAADDPTLTTVVVTAEAAAEAAVTGSTGTGSQFQVNGAGMILWGGPGATNPYKAVSGMPSVNTQSADAYGLSNLPGGTKGMRVRGELATHGAMGSVDGIPLGTVNPGPGYLWAFDADNLSAVILQQGAVSPDQTNLFTTQGALDSRLRWPGAQSGLHVSQALGSSNFTRTRARWDSGHLSGGGALFVSASHTAAEKWRGPGNAPAARNNFAVALVQPLGDVEIKVMATHNDMRAHHYRALTYAQALNLDTFRNDDFDAVSSATATQAVNYYDYNRQDFTNWSVLGEIAWKLSERASLVVKPYYLNEEGYYLEGQTNGRVRQWLVDHAWYGFTSEYQTRFAGVSLKLGYWLQSTEPPGPPTAWKTYTPNAAGDLTGAVTWSILAKVTDRHRFDSAYVVADRQFGGLKLEGGVRYLNETLPGIAAYNTTGIGNVSYEQALAQSVGVIASRSADSFSLDAWLPYLGLGYSFTPAVSLKASLGRNYGAPSFDIWPVFQQSAATFLINGVTAQDLWRTLKPELSEALDLGLRVGLTRVWIEPTLYLARFHDKKVQYDFDGAGPLPAYSSNVAETRAWGAQLVGGWNPLSGLNLFGGVSWNRNEFTENLPVAGAANLQVEGKQIPDVPVWQANLGATWSKGAISVSPVMRYSGVRYGDTEHTQRIPGYTTADLNLTWQARLSVGKLAVSLSALNLFDREYIGVIRSDYYQLLSGGSAIYYPGAPRTGVAKISLDF